MIRGFKDRKTRRLFEGHGVREFQGFSDQAVRRLTVLNSADTLQDLANLRSNRFNESIEMKITNGMRPVHPGEILREELDVLEMSANALAAALGVPGNRITAILNGQRGISADTALRLSRYLGTTAEFWLNLQKSYELRLAEREAGKKIEETVTPRMEAA